MNLASIRIKRKETIENIKPAGISKRPMHRNNGRIPFEDAMNTSPGDEIFSSRDPARRIMNNVMPSALSQISMTQSALFPPSESDLRTMITNSDSISAVPLPMQPWSDPSLPALQNIDNILQNSAPHLGSETLAGAHATPSSNTQSSAALTVSVPEDARIDEDDASRLLYNNASVHALLNLVCPRCNKPSPSSAVVKHPLECKDPSKETFIIGYTTVRCVHCNIDHTECINNPEHGRLVWHRVTKNTKKWLLKCPQCARKRARSPLGDRGEWTRCENSKCLGLYLNSEMRHNCRLVTRDDREMFQRKMHLLQSSTAAFLQSNRSSTHSVPFVAGARSMALDASAALSNSPIASLQYLNGRSQHQRKRLRISPDGTLSRARASSKGHALTLLASASVQAPVVDQLFPSGDSDMSAERPYYASRLTCPRCKQNSSNAQVYNHPLQCRDPTKKYFKVGYTTVRCTRCNIDHTECINNAKHGRLVWQRVTRRNHKTRWFLRCPKCALKRSQTGKGERGEWTRCEHPDCLGLYRSNRGTNNDRSIEKHNETINAVNKRKNTNQFMRPGQTAEDNALRQRCQAISRLLMVGAFSPDQLPDELRMKILWQMGLPQSHAAV